jgi:hypothetical protein
LNLRNILFLFEMNMDKLKLTKNIDFSIKLWDMYNAPPVIFINDTNKPNIFSARIRLFNSSLKYLLVEYIEDTAKVISDHSFIV